VRSIAYLDSSSVSMVASAVVAGLAGVVVVLKMGFRRVTSVFSPARRAALRAEKASRASAQAES
jgi:hypothetical protein